MSTTAQKFYLDVTADDGTYGTTVDKLSESAPGANSATTNTWSSTAVSTQTEIPLTASSTSSDTSSNNGWAFNNGGADGLGSTATAERIILAGVWNFSMSYTLNSPALLATIACSVTAKVYRVATGGGTRTLLFSATSGNFSASATVTWSSASQPQYTLAAGEVIMIGYTATSAATAALVLGAVTNTVLTLNLGANSFLNVASPGVRTLNIKSVTSAATGVNVAQPWIIKKKLALVATGVIGQVKIIVKKPVFAVATGVVKIVKQINLPIKLVATGIISIVKKVIFSRLIVGVGVANITRRLTLFRKFTNVSTTVNNFARRVIAARTFTSSTVGSIKIIKTVKLPVKMTATGVVFVIKKVIKKFTNTATGTIKVTKKIIKLRLLITAVGVSTFNRKLILARSIAVTASGKVFNFARLAFRNIPSGSGGTTIIKKISNYIFDD